MADEEDDDAAINQCRMSPFLPSSSVTANVSFAPPQPPQQPSHHPTTTARDANSGNDDENHDDIEAGNGTSHRRLSLPPLTLGTTSSSSATSYFKHSPNAQSISNYLNREATVLRSSVKQVLRWRKGMSGPRDVKPGVRAFHNKLLNASRPALACFLATGISMVYPWSNNVTWFSITLSISGVGRNLGHTVEGIRQQWLGTMVAIPLCFFLKLFAFSKLFTAVMVFLVSVLVAGTSTLSEAAKKLCLIFITWDVLVPLVAPSITIENLMEDLLKAVLGANIACFFVMLCPVPHLAVFLCRWRLEELQEVLGRFLEDAADSFCLQDDSGLHDLEDVIDEAAALVREARALLPDVKFELALLGCGCARPKGRLVYERVVQYLGVLEGQLENCRGMAVALSDMFPNATHSEFVKAMRPPLLSLVLESKVVLEGTCHHVCAGLHGWVPWGQWRRRRKQLQQKWRSTGKDVTMGDEDGRRRRPSLGGSGDDENGLGLGSGVLHQHQHQHLHQHQHQQQNLGGDKWRGRRPSVDGEDCDETGAMGQQQQEQEQQQQEQEQQQQQQQQQQRRRGLSKLSDTDDLDCEKEEYGDDDEGHGVPAELFLPPKVALAQVLHELLKTRMRVVYGVELKAKARTDPPMSNGNGTISASSSSFLTHRRKTRSLSIGSFALTSPTSIVFERSTSAAAAAERFQKESARVGYMNLLPRNAFVLDLKLFIEAFDVHKALCGSHSMPLLQQPPQSPSTLSSCAAAEAAATTTAAAATTAAARQQRCPSCVSLPKRLYHGIYQGPGPGLKSWRQPVKVGLAILLSSIVVLVDDKHLGLQTIWCPITVAQTMSSHPSSAFKSGANRVQGTVLGAVMGMAVTTWAPIHNKALIVLVLTLWVFICAFNRGSPTYGEVAVSAALTAPIVVVGPVIGSSGAVVRISQVILGTVIYVAVDNLIFPTRAKLLLRTEMCTAVQKLLGLCRDGLATFRVGVEMGRGPSFLRGNYDGISSDSDSGGTAGGGGGGGSGGAGSGMGMNGTSTSTSTTSTSSRAAVTTAATKGGGTEKSAVKNTAMEGTGTEGPAASTIAPGSASTGEGLGLPSSRSTNPSPLPSPSTCASRTPTIPPIQVTNTHTSHTSARLAAAVGAAKKRVRRDSVAIRQALVKEALYISLASDEPELWHKPFQRDAYLKVHAIQLRMHRYLLMLHRSAASFPEELAEWDQEMLRAYESIILRLQRTVEAVFTEALARLQLLRSAQGRVGGKGLKRRFNMGGCGSAGGVNVFQIREEFRDIQDTIDGLVTEYFARDPVLTSLNFIVPLNGMIYSTRKMSTECVKFVQAVRELMLREGKIGKGAAMAAAAEVVVPGAGSCLERGGREGGGGGMRRGRSNK